VFHSIAAIVSGLYSTYERKHAGFGLLNLVNFTEDDVLQDHPFTCKRQNFIFPNY
jgi:hypothetical protein